MPKWADYVISAVKKSSGKITHFVVHDDHGSKVGEGVLLPEWRVIELLKKRNICTIVWNYKSGAWTKGCNVEIEKANGRTYLVCDIDKETRDTQTNTLYNMLPAIDLVFRSDLLK